MGLHLNYELRLPDSATAEAVGNVLVRLRDFALALPFKSVTEIYRPEPGRFDSRVAVYGFWRPSSRRCLSMRLRR
jgi:hypothetical protein